MLGYSKILASTTKVTVSTILQPSTIIAAISIIASHCIFNVSFPNSSLVGLITFTSLKTFEVLKKRSNRDSSETILQNTTTEKKQKTIKDNLSEIFASIKYFFFYPKDLQYQLEKQEREHEKFMFIIQLYEARLRMHSIEFQSQMLKFQNLFSSTPTESPSKDEVYES